MKGRLRPFDYMAWAQTVPTGARFNLTRSGIDDVADADGGVADELFATGLDARDLSRRGARDRIVGEFLDAVAERYGVEPAHVTPTLGAGHAITQSVVALARAGDHVIVERPTYEALHRVPEVFGVSVSRLERQADEGWAPLPDRLAQLLTPRTRAVLLSNLHNPSGVGLGAGPLASIAEMAERVGARVLVDEVYLDFDFDPEGGNASGAPACRAADNGVSWSSMTKSLGLSALRVGWIVTRDEEAGAAIRDASAYFAGDSPLAPLAVATRALRNSRELVHRANAAIEASRAVVDAWVANEPRVAWVPPTAGQTCLLRLPELMQDVAFSAHLREQHGVQVVPGSMFEAPGYVRVSFGLPPDDLREALACMGRALDELG